jgi:hypothetical protein
MHCPSCGQFMREGLFLCMDCAAKTPDSLIIEMAEAHDAGDETAKARVVKRIRRKLGG